MEPSHQRHQGQAAVRLLRDGGGAVEFSRFVAALVPSCCLDLADLEDLEDGQECSPNV